ncbi:hypothetical protein DERP_013874 [Dermatophagoides pteronyssinus]|uniref:Uncharacterized protein n=1 Tax=Dermatophagoides pteronyssinus TaxID=6956 RepID=A0ABQ8J2Y2_DERPT|nr:hypothetical protein DERP_013874 [Dermatophagoides pteronyssinus]
MLHRITKIGPSKSLKWELKFGDIFMVVASSKDRTIFLVKDVEEVVAIVVSPHFLSFLVFKSISVPPLLN